MHWTIKGVDRVVSRTRREYQRIYILRRLIGIGVSKDATIRSDILFLTKRVLHVSFVNQIFGWVAGLNLWCNWWSFLPVRLVLRRWNWLILLLARLRLIAFFAEKLFESKGIVLNDSWSILVWVYHYSIWLRRPFLWKNSYYIFPFNGESEDEKGCLLLTFISERIASIALTLPICWKLANFIFLVDAFELML